WTDRGTSPARSISGGSDRPRRRSCCGRTTPPAISARFPGNYSATTWAICSAGRSVGGRDRLQSPARPSAPLVLLRAGQAHLPGAGQDGVLEIGGGVERHRGVDPAGALHLLAEHRGADAVGAQRPAEDVDIDLE